MTPMLRRILAVTPALAVAVAVAAPARVNAQGVEGYYRYPTVHGSTIVFTAEGDLWRVDRNGGQAQRLTTHHSDETRAQISPDGRTIAFTAAYEGPTEVYTMPIAGGLPKRLTFDGGGAGVVGWTPDNRVLYATSKFAGLPTLQLAQVDPAGGKRTLIPLAQASDGAIAGDGTLYFTRFPFQGSNARGYRGGTAQQLWKWNTKSEAEAVPLTTTYTGTSKTPMVHGNRIYFASDRSSGSTADPKPSLMNIWSSDLDGSNLQQITHHSDYEVATPSMSPDGKLVYQHGADIWYVDVAAGGPDARMVPRKVRITLATDLEQMREQWITNPMSSFQGAHLSPNGDRVLITTLGHVWVAPTQQGRLSLATPQPKDRFIRFRDARFMPDGKSLLALSDESGEVELWTTPANGIGERRQLTSDGDIVRWDALPSPDGNFIAHHDRNNKLYIYDVAAKRNRTIATSMTQSNWISSGSGFFDLAWSPDSRWIAYGDVASNMVGRIALYDTESERTVFATTDRFNSYNPAWSPDGKWLFFLSHRNFQSSVGSPWGFGSPDPYFDNQTKIYAVALQKSGAKWPYVEKTELDAVSAVKADTTKSPPPSKNVAIDVDGLATRLYEVPVTPGNYGSLSFDGTRLYWQSSIAGTPRRNPLMQIEFKNEAKAEVYMEDVPQYELSQDHKKMLVRRGNNLWVVDAGAKAPTSLTDNAVDLSGWTFPVNPVAMRQQMFEDAWRLERDYFYDPKMAGVDWNAMRMKYRPLAARVTTRAELSDVLAQMVAELSTLHTSVGGGDLRRGDDNVVPASLGAQLDRDEATGGYRVIKIYRHDPDIPNDRAPLADPAVNVGPGDVITAINGVPALTSSPDELLRNQAGRQVLMSVQPAAGGAVRQVVVTPWPQGREFGARYTEWEYTRRLAVDSLSDGKVGYLHLRAMGGGDMAQFTRDYFPAFNKQGLIIDVRNNNGGNIDTWVLSRLMRKAWSYWQPRVGEPYNNMPYSFTGPMVVLVNERTASDGEAFAEGFRRLGLGKVIGTRTWGGEVWLSRDNVLVDGGIASAAQQGLHGMAERKLIIEGWGVDPDIIVDNLPWETFKGRDRQLEAAVRELLNGGR